MASKRASSSSEVPAAKKSRTAADQFETVIEGLKLAELPAAVMKTLCSIVPYCLGVPTEQRHKFQEQAIEKIDGVFTMVTASLEQGIQAAELTKVQLQGDFASHEQELQQTRSLAQTRREEAKAQKIALAKVAQEFQASKRSLAQLREQQELCRVEATGKRAEVEALFQELDAIPGSEDSALAAETFVGRVAQHMELPENLRLEILSTSVQAPASRDSSSAAVIQQVHDMLAAAAAELSVIIAGSDAGAQGVEAAEKEHTVLSQKQVTAARLYTEAADAASTMQSELEIAEQMLLKLQRAAKEADEALEEALANRDLFAQGPVETLASLRSSCSTAAQSLPCDVPAVA
mmetsp:Transcript_45148/g.98157  ORF Transcript_45148/g.98157 Transcript_45148/m.98157 type:complete len:348 (+) Transcript_45148:51-1094(+)